MRFRSLVETYKQRYNAVSKNQKTSIAVEIVRRWRSLEPRGGFLTKTDPSLGDASPWKDIGHKKAVIKALQCLRERASPTRAQTQALFNTTSSGQQTPAAGCFPHYPLHQAHFPQAHVAASLTTQSAASSSPPTPSAPVPAYFQAGSAPPTMMPNMFARNPSLSASSSRNSSLSSVSQQGLQPHQQEVTTSGTVNATYTLPVSAPSMMTGAHCNPAPSNVQFGQALATVFQAALANQAPAGAPPALVPNNTNILQVMLVQEVAKLLGGITPSPSPPPAYQPVAVTPLPRTVSPSLSPTVAALSHQPVPPMIPMAVMASLVGMMSASSSAPPAPQANTGFQSQPPAPPPTGTATPPPAAAASTNPAQSKLTPAELTTVIQLLTATSSGAGVTGQPPSGGGESVVSPMDIQRVLALGKIMTGVAARGK